MTSSATATSLSSGMTLAREIATVLGVTLGPGYPESVYLRSVADLLSSSFNAAHPLVPCTYLPANGSNEESYAWLEALRASVDAL